MRLCLRCRTEMAENFYVRVKGAPYGVEISADKHWLLASDILGEPKAAVCPNCGEISFYLTDTSAVRKGTK